MRFALLLFGLAGYTSALSQTYVTFGQTRGGFSLAGGTSTPIVVETGAWKGVARAARDLQNDLQEVTGVKPTLLTAPGRRCVIVGTVGKSHLIDEMARKGKLDLRAIRGKWEATLTQVVKRPLPGVEEALVIAGSDKRGTIYGIYALSEQAGVSPWHWWADVPVKHHARLFVTPGAHVQRPPAVKYRGIFINDEAPSLTNWVLKNFGDYRHEFYAHVFELLLRLRANYLWPAMWNNCFSQDDPANPALADEYGIVMGTSHVEPMMRADKEWNRAGLPPEWWNYDKHPAELEKFWADGIERNKPYENIITVGMRGKIDTPMSETANISLLERIVAVQRRIIARQLGVPAEQVPQLWCLYKEVQEYYEKGMRVPDDVTLLWADDNWGNIRRLPTPEERSRSGGAGVYYHLDYVGGPRNYKWLNTTQIERVWEQMHLAYTCGADRIWIVNVGDIKPLEFPTEFFLRYAWEPDRWDASTLMEYTRRWCAREFGARHAGEIAELIDTYAKYNARRKPELLEPNTYSLTNYNEAETVVADYRGLATRAERLEGLLSSEYRAAYYELVLHPILACANLNELYVAAAKNRLYAAQGRSSANLYGEQVRQLFARDEALTRRYHALKGGRWDHMMDQTHIGYTTWQQPDKQTMPSLQVVHPPAAGSLGVTVEGSDGPSDASLPELVPGQSRWIDLFNKGTSPVRYSVKPAQAWIRVSRRRGTLGSDRRISVSLDPLRVPTSSAEGSIDVLGSDGSRVTIPVSFNATDAKGICEQDGCVSVEAEHYTSQVGSASDYWKPLPRLGRTLGAMTMFPPNAPAKHLLMHLEYRSFFFSSGPVTISAYLSPTQLLWPGPGLCYGVSIDDEPLQRVNMHAGYVYFTPTWEKSVADNINIGKSQHLLKHPGWHTVKFWAIDPGVVLQKLVVETTGARRSYLGPPETRR